MIVPTPTPKYGDQTIPINLLLVNQVSVNYIDLIYWRRSRQRSKKWMQSWESWVLIFMVILSRSVFFFLIRFSSSTIYLSIYHNPRYSSSGTWLWRIVRTNFSLSLSPRFETENHFWGFTHSHAHDVYTAFMTKHGFEVIKKYHLDTAWKATFTHGTGGRTIGINSEVRLGILIRLLTRKTD